VRRALVVVDIIEDFVHEAGAFYRGASMGKIVPITERELGRARRADEPVYLTDEHLPDDAEFAQFPPQALKVRRARRAYRGVSTSPTGGTVPRMKDRT
jgi:nicotinamidase-related amidase